MGAHGAQRKLIRGGLILLAGGFTQFAAAGEIVRWVDENGITQFTDPQLAAAPATTVEVQPANAMDVPTAAPARTTGRPAFTKISKPPKKNKRGWQGYQTNRKRNRNWRRR
ncbi:MAG: DUF4124 domain-containing protein [Gammaproteobacteria bacterium]|nr:DUF4124 domain-containing protein [Gammaproteobacteria bacterium]